MSMVKKIIAREGLVVMGIVLVGVCLLNTPNIFSITVSVGKEYEDTAKKIETLYQTPRYNNFDIDTKLDLEVYRRLLLQGETPDKQALMSLNAWLDGTSKLFPDEVYGPDGSERLGVSEVNPFHIIGGNVLVFGYPLYWLLRFIRWAILTLREKE